jgi:hypothetical protein
MRQMLFATLMLALVATASGCKLCNGLGWKHGCPDGCGHGACGPGGCPDGACGPGGACGPDGHANPYEPFHGHAPVQRGGLLDHIHASSMASGPVVGGGLGGRRGMGADGMGGPGGLQPTPPASAGAVSYPYYTTRGPRDFLSPNPRGIGP